MPAASAELVRFYIDAIEMSRGAVACSAAAIGGVQSATAPSDMADAAGSDDVATPERSLRGHISTNAPAPARLARGRQAAAHVRQLAFWDHGDATPGPSLHSGAAVACRTRINVLNPMSPVARSPCDSWKRRTAALVSGPFTPSSGPGSNFRARSLICNS
jgi:hypothetical protein